MSMTIRSILMYSLTDCTGLRVLGRRGVQTFGDCVHTQCHDGQHDVAKHKKACSDHANTPYHPRRPDSSQDHKVHTTFPPPTSEGNALRRCHLKQFNCSCMRDSSRTHAHSLHRTLWVTQSLDRQCTSFKCRPADHLQAASTTICDHPLREVTNVLPSSQCSGPWQLPPLPPA